MKLGWRLKRIVLTSLLAMYLTGLATWFLGHWWLVESGFGLEPTPFRNLALQFHSVISLWFLVLFGYLARAHVIPAWYGGRKIKSGVAVTGTLVVLIATIPGLFYLTLEPVKSAVVCVHTYLGIATLAVFLIHYFSPASSGKID